jgi:hypothetical protein
MAPFGSHPTQDVASEVGTLNGSGTRLPSPPATNGHTIPRAGILRDGSSGARNGAPPASDDPGPSPVERARAADKSLNGHARADDVVTPIPPPRDDVT